MRLNNKHHAELLIMLLLPSFLLALDVRGTVKTVAGIPVHSALVVFVSERDSTLRFSSLTDSLGQYRIVITNIPAVQSPTPQFALHQNYPNPFAESTMIGYSTENRDDAVVTIYDILGREIRRFQLTANSQTANRVLWDGRDKMGQKVASGVYFYRLTSSEKAETKKMLYGRHSEMLASSAMSHVRFQSFANSVRIFPDTYTLLIENTDSTRPKIEPVKQKNLTIARDTLLDLTVQEAFVGKWELLGLQNETVTAIALHPNDTAIIYAGTMFDFSAGVLGQLFKSEDFGKTWDTLLIGGSYRDIVIDPVNPETVYALPHQIIKSTNGGRTWQDASIGIRLDWETRVGSFAIDPKNPNVLYAGTGGFFGGSLYKSTDGGQSWRDLASGDTLSDGVISLAVDPINSNIIYAGTAWRGQVLKSTDAGNSWNVTGLGDNRIPHNLLIHPRNSQLIFAATGFRGVWKSSNGGETWNSFNEGLPDTVSGIKLAMNSESFELYLIATAREGGWLYRRDNFDTQWTKMGINEIRTSYYYSDLELSPLNRFLYLGIRGLYRFRFH